MPPMVKEARYDIFFSYAWEDQKRATELVLALRSAGMTVFQDFSRMEDFDDIGMEIRSALERSRTLVALYSPDFPRSPYCQWELHSALTWAYQLDGHIRRVMTVVQDLAYSDVRPRGLTDLRLPARNAPGRPGRMFGGGGCPPAQGR
jgi:TIR domain